MRSHSDLNELSQLAIIRYNDLKVRHGGSGNSTLEEFSCYRCQAVSTCPCAYDIYNTDGDCLEDK